MVLAIFISAFGAFPAYAESTSDLNYFVSSATIFAVSTTSITVRNVSDGAVVPSISFGTIVSSGVPYGTLAPQYVQISVNDNSILWLMRAYTDNFAAAPDTTTWGTQYGGLISTTPASGNHVPMGWQCSTYTVVGVPVVSSATTPGGNWNYLKDQWDTDFVASRNAGYCNIAFGSASYTRVVEPSVPGVSVPLGHTTDNFYFVTEADFASAINDAYAFDLVLELVHQ